MKKLFILAAAIVTGFAASAQTKAGDVIKPEVAKYSFGKIKQNVPATVYFTFTNTSDKPVVIENAWAGCGCTTPEYSKLPVPAGGTTLVKVGYNAAAMGQFTKDVNIKLAGIQAPLTVYITGEVVDAAAFDAYTKTSEYKKAEKERTARLAKDEKAFKALKTSK